MRKEFVWWLAVQPKLYRAKLLCISNGETTDIKTMNESNENNGVHKVIYLRNLSCFIYEWITWRNLTTLQQKISEMKSREMKREQEILNSNKRRNDLWKNWTPAISWKQTQFNSIEWVSLQPTLHPIDGQETWRTSLKRS